MKGNVLFHKYSDVYPFLPRQSIRRKNSPKNGSQSLKLIKAISNISNKGIRMLIFATSITKKKEKEEKKVNMKKKRKQVDLSKTFPQAEDELKLPVKLAPGSHGWK